MRLSIVVSLLLVSGATPAQDLKGALAKCRGLADSLQRLVCYDKLVDQGADAASMPRKMAPHVKKQCTSASGKSLYDLNFSLLLKNGQIRIVGEVE